MIERTRTVRRATLTLTALLATACAPAASKPVTPGRVTDHVLIISVDGLRPDAIDRLGARTVQRLMREGSFARDARTIVPSSTLPSHASMLTGVEPRVHGIGWNSDEIGERGRVRVRTVFGLARAAGLRTAAFFGKPKLNHLDAPGTLDYAHSLDSLLPRRGAGARTAQLVGKYLERARPNLLFVHLVDPDLAGHLSGWMGPDYARAVQDADSALGAVLAHADARFGVGEYVVIVTADHGGHDRTHGTKRPEDMTIPWIAWGEGVRAGAELRSGVRTTETAATALWLLGVAIPRAWSGRPVTQAFYTAGAAPTTPAAH